jgi:hypothetical protein
MATVALKNLACPNHITGPFLHEYLLLNRKIGQCLSQSRSKTAAGAATSLKSLHTIERRVGILGLELIESAFDFLKSRLRFLLVPFVSSAVQVGYCTVQLLQRRGHFWPFVSAQHAAVLLQRRNLPLHSVPASTVIIIIPPLAR